MSDKSRPATETEAHSVDLHSGLRFARIAGGWWTGATRKTAAFLTLTLGSLLVLNVGVNFLINAWNRRFFDALEAQESKLLSGAVLEIIGLVFASAAIGVGVVLARETLQVRWREWLVKRLVDRWISRQRFYRMGLAQNEPANPEYRIADDSRLATEPVVDFLIGLLTSLVSAATFVGVLFKVGGSLKVDWGTTHFTIPAFMVLAAIIYGVMVSWFIVLIGSRLPGEVARRNEAEAKLRFDLTRLRENAESVALIKGGADEQRAISTTYGQLVGRWLTVIQRHAKLTWVTHSSGVFVPVLPLILAAPKYLSGDLTLGEVTQLAGAFVHVQVAIVWLVDNFRAIAQCYASVHRVNELDEAMDAIDETDQEQGSGIERQDTQAGEIRLEKLRLTDRSDRCLMGETSLTIPAGEKVLITGDSGSGKSTLVRALAGLWPWGQGMIGLPRDKMIAFVPQRAYLPTGQLRDVLLYPVGTTPIDDAVLLQALHQVGLGHIADRLNEAARWDQLLSNGERQRLAIARLLVHKPDIIIMDGATSALDEASLKSIMTLLGDELKDSTMLTIADRPVLDAYHSRRITLSTRTEGSHVTVTTIQAEKTRANRLRVANPS